jgi:hypothetical protein
VAGSFPKTALAVAGSPGLERLAARVRAMGATERAEARQALGLAPGDRAAIVVSKRAQLGRWLPLLVTAIERLDSVAAASPGPARPSAGESLPSATAGGTRLILKPHPAETAELYEDAVGASPAARLAPAGLDLAALLVAGDLVVTVNSTVAIDAMALGIPALSVGVPNNLTPFVTAGGMAGVFDAGDLEPSLARLLHDETARAELVARGLACAASAGIRTDGGAAARAADTLAALAAAGPTRAASQRHGPGRL